jgi:hypothetical protein
MFPSILPHPLAAALLLSAAASSQAATLLVTLKTDSYDGVCNHDCSLRDAVAEANQTGGPHTILLPTGTYPLSLPAALDDRGVPQDEDANLDGDLDIASDVTIKGGGHNLTIIQGMSNDRLLEVLPAARLVLKRLALVGGNTAHNGGAVENHGQLQLREILLRRNKAQTQSPDGAPIPDEDALSHGQGGAIANLGDLQVFESHFRFNTAIGFRDNNLGRGGAIFNRGNLQVWDTTFQHNSVHDQLARGAGGAIYNLSSARIERSSFLDNQGSELAVGGAIANESGELTLTNSTLSHQTVTALSNGFPDNQPGDLAKATLTNVTIAANDSSHAVTNWAQLLVRNSVIAGNYDFRFERKPANCVNMGEHFSYQAIGLLTNDLPGNCSGDFYVPFEDTFEQVLFYFARDKLTWIHAPRPGSPAIDAAIGSCPGLDQRGVFRPQDGNGDGVAVCDLGAVEFTAQ